ncbi:MAG: hypothetical protein ACYC61_09600 [Isosphaeraceae bacterium]
MPEQGRSTTFGRLAAALIAAAVLPACAVVPRSQLDESLQLTRSLRADNARLKDQVVDLQAQNRDASDRALDDVRRLAARDEAIERLRRSVQQYQDDRDRLEAAYRRLAASLGRSPDVASTPTDPESPPEAAEVR